MRQGEDGGSTLRVSERGGSSGRSTTMFVNAEGKEAEWSATGMPGVSLAEQGRGAKSADSYGHADNVFASERTLSRLTEMGSMEYLESQRSRWEEARLGGRHAVRR